ncbi:MAG: restriction endonuclease subunit S [Prolixibacteraceae bacterium]|nr:restriction endonuclease subunit S [Prolixibacteraceae bacterium]
MGKLIAIDRPAEELKDSGVDFIGDIPNHWGIDYINKIFVFAKTGVQPYEGAKRYYATGSVNGKDLVPEGVYNFIDKPTRANRICNIGDIIEARMKNTEKAYIVTEGYNDCLFSTGFIQIQKSNNYLSSWVLYQLLSDSFRKAKDNLCLGATQPQINDTNLYSIKLPVVGIDEQRLIANYLDNTVSQIDSSISSSEKLIEQLKLYKRAIITEAVTKGLDPTVPMKDSGVEWIGEIPAHWEVKTVDELFDVVLGATPKSNEPDYWDGDLTWITPADYKTSEKYIKNSKRKITSSGYNSCSTRMLPVDSIVISSRAPIGSVALTAVELCTNQGCKSLVQKGEAISPEFVYYYMSIMDKQLNIIGSGTTFLELSTTNLKKFKIPFTSIEEQEVIINYLNTQTSIIDKKISHLSKTVEELECFKKALIFECVTGKKKVIEVED